MRQLAQSGVAPLVVTVFGGRPSPGVPLSPFARSLHARWEEPGDAVASRQEEDLAALAVLGARADHWEYTDCIYRQTPAGEHAYDSEESLWAEIHRDERQLVAEIAERLAALPLARGGTLCVPLGLGHHVDHRIVRAAADEAAVPVSYYEDFPYAEDPQELAKALKGTDLVPEVVVLSAPALEAKVAAVACYASQISTFWSSMGEMSVRVRAFAEFIGDGQPAERYWNREPAQ